MVYVLNHGRKSVNLNNFCSLASACKNISTIAPTTLGVTNEVDCSDGWDLA